MENIGYEQAILKFAYTEMLGKVKADLIARGEKVRWIYTQELTADRLKRVQIEEDHITQLAGFIETVENLIAALEDAVEDRRGIEIIWHKEYINELEDHARYSRDMINVQLNGLKEIKSLQGEISRFKTLYERG